MLSRKAGFVEKTVDLLIRIRWPLLLAAIVLTAVAWPEAQELSLNRTMENTLPEGNPYRKAYEKSRRIFGTRDSVIVAYPEPHVFQKGSLRLTDEARRNMQQLAKKLQQVPGVAPNSVYGLDQALKLNFRREQLVEMLEGMLLGSDHKTVALVLQLERSEEYGRVARRDDFPDQHDRP